MNSKAAKPSREPSLVEYERRYVRPVPGRTLIVGSQIYAGKEDRRLRYEHCLGVDMLAGPGVDRVLDLEETLPDDLGLFVHIECMSVLEHSRRPWLLAANLERILVPGGSIFVAAPFCWRIHAYPSDYWRLTPEALAVIFPGIAWESLLLAGVDVRNGPKIPLIKVDGHPYFARTESVGFGYRL